MDKDIIDVYMHGQLHNIHYEIVTIKSSNILAIRETNKKIDVSDEIYEFVKKLEKKILK